MSTLCLVTQEDKPYMITFTNYP